MEKIVVLITVPSEEDAANIGYTLVAEKLAACVNIVEGIRSIYAWQGEVHDEPECLLVVKTVAENFDALAERVKELHSYEVPEIIALPILKGSTEYLDWVWENTRRE